MNTEELEKMMKKDVKENDIIITQCTNYSPEILCEEKLFEQNFKIYGTKENPLFLAKDILKFIEHTHITKMLEVVDEDEKVKYLCTDSSGVFQKNTVYWFITRDGLFEILMQSRKPIAKQFKKEVKRILNEIQSTGGYVVKHREEEFIENHYNYLSPELKNAMITEMREHIKKQNAIIEEQNKKILLDAPKVDYHDSVLNCEKLISVNEIANDIGISAKALNQFLHDEGIQYKQGKSWKIYSKHYNLITDKYCDYHITEYGQQLKWTEKGRKFILELYYSKDKEE